MFRLPENLGERRSSGKWLSSSIEGDEDDVEDAGGELVLVLEDLATSPSRSACLKNWESIDVGDPGQCRSAR